MQKPIALVTIIILIILSNVCMSNWIHADVNDNSIISLSGDAAVLDVNTRGGAIREFHLTSGAVTNPFSWTAGEGASRMGHFMCFDRWGQPSEAEAEHGIPFHGEAGDVMWEITEEPNNSDGVVMMSMKCSLPLAGMNVERTIRLEQNTALATVTETFTNSNILGRVYNVVQHPTIGPPFLDETTIVETNAYKGFTQYSPGEPVIYWPHIIFEGKHVDLRHLGAESSPGVTSFIFKDGVEQGWVTAVNTDMSLLTGYVWNIADYPWLNIWRYSAEGKPMARGLEFGTTGLHRPYPDLIAQHSYFDTRLYEYLDADASATKTYTVFLIEVPNDYNGTGSVTLHGNLLTVTEKGNNRKYKLEYTP